MDTKIIEYVTFFLKVAIPCILIVIICIRVVKSCIRDLRIIRTPQEKSTYVPQILKCESPIEKRVYNGLLQHGLYPTAQYRQGRYRIDLAFPGSMLAIECDGKAYHSSPEQKAHDRKKDKFLREQGWTVLRFTGSRIHRDLPGVVDKIKDNLK